MRRSLPILLALLLAGPAWAQQPSTSYASRFKFIETGCTMRSGSGSPEGVVVGSVCDVYVRQDTSGLNPAIYTKQTGTLTNTGWVAVGGSAAPVDATYITQTANATLTNEQALGTLATGLLKNATTTGILSIATAGTDYTAGTAALATGILKSTTSTGALSIASASDVPQFWSRASTTLSPATAGDDVNVTYTALGTTPVSAVTLDNSTAAANNAQQVSPAQTMTGRGWASDSSASQTVGWRWYVLPVQRTTPAYSKLVFQYKLGTESSWRDGIIFTSPSDSGYASMNVYNLTVGNNLSVSYYTQGSKLYTVSNWGFSNDFPIAWSSTTSASGAKDTGLSRSAAGVVAVGNGTNGDYSGTVQATAYKAGTTAGVDCTSAAAVTVSKGIVTACSAPDPLLTPQALAAEIAALKQQIAELQAALGLGRTK